MRSGQVAIVGVGPGGPQMRTAQADEALFVATDLVGYGPYLDLVEPGPPGQKRHVFDNREEAVRACFALDLAAEGRRVAVVSSGDPGVFAMATAVVEELHRDDSRRWAAVEVRIVPGVTAASAAAALAGAPLGHDFCVVSLSDVLKPWALVERRLDAAAGADFVLALYNPISRHRPWQLGRALEIVGRYRAPSTPVVVARRVGRSGEHVSIVRLADVLEHDIDMSTVLIIGSSTTVAFADRGGRTWAYTPRHHPG